MEIELQLREQQQALTQSQPASKRSKTVDTEDWGRGIPHFWEVWKGAFRDVSIREWVPPMWQSWPFGHGLQTADSGLQSQTLLSM